MTPLDTARALTRNEAKLVRSLALKKHRDATGLFLAEGTKCATELLRHFPCELLVATPEFLENPPAPLADIAPTQVAAVTSEELRRLSLQQHPQQVLAVLRQPAAAAVPAPPDGLALALDGVQDPGNLGTILRTADWFGVRTVYASPDTADSFAPKVVQATMGALGRVRVAYTPLAPLLAAFGAEGVAVCGTFMDGESLYETEIPRRAVVVMGNEGRGVRPETAAVCTRRLTIPRYTPAADGSESLNVATATAIVVGEVMRKLSVF
ncbi:MAG: RNA methyltransferase [Bacteroidaceae bacterium]|nr:RNA methyltransferase [Bacteroidaceae bacterium]